MVMQQLGQQDRFDIPAPDLMGFGHGSSDVQENFLQSL